jgi:hypothetical protein
MLLFVEETGRGCAKPYWDDPSGMEARPIHVLVIVRVEREGKRG